jgi:hypothetical protein
LTLLQIMGAAAMAVNGSLGLDETSRGNSVSLAAEQAFPEVEE